MLRRDDQTNNAIPATAVVISASSGTVSVYDGGETVLELERAYPGS